jgi:hypothetical protein
MENSFLNNKIILKYCPDYYRIINVEFNDFDYMTDKIIGIYQSYIFSVNVNNKSDLKSVNSLNKAIARYIDDREFKTILNNFLSSLKVSKKETNVMSFIAGAIIGEYDKYMEGFTRNLYIPRWI